MRTTHTIPGKKGTWKVLQQGIYHKQEANGDTENITVFLMSKTTGHAVPVIIDSALQIIVNKAPAGFTGLHGFEPAAEDTAKRHGT